MKTSLLFSLSFFLLSFSSYAQVKWGAQAGLALTYLVERTEGTPTMDEDRLLLSPCLGLDVLVPLHEQRLFLRSGLRFTGAGEAQETSQGSDFMDVRLWYAQIPLDLAFRLTPALEFRGGLWSSLLLGHNLMIEDVSRGDAGWAVGFSWIINPQWELGLRYGQGLVDVYDARRLILESDPEELKIGVRNQLAGVYFTYYWAVEGQGQKK